MRRVGPQLQVHDWRSTRCPDAEVHLFLCSWSHHSNWRSTRCPDAEAVIRPLSTPLTKVSVSTAHLCLWRKKFPTWVFGYKTCIGACAYTLTILRIQWQQAIIQITRKDQTHKFTFQFSENNTETSTTQKNYRTFAKNNKWFYTVILRSFLTTQWWTKNSQNLMNITDLLRRH